MPVATKLAAPLGLALLLIACSDDVTEPKPPGITVVAGAGLTDTIEAQLPQALTIEVRDKDGAVRSGAIVRFEAQAPDVPGRLTDPAVQLCAVGTLTACAPPVAASLAIDTTDDRGRAFALVRLGRVPTRAVVRIHVPELGLVDSVDFTVLPGNAVRTRAGLTDTALVVGVPAQLPPGRVVDRYENTRAETVTYRLSVPNNLTFESNTRIATGRDIGSQFIHVESGTLLADAMMIRTVPPGRLVVWSSTGRELRLVGTDATDTRTIATLIASDLGAFPHFDPTRRFVTVHDGTFTSGGPPVLIVVADTAGSQREVPSSVPFSSIMVVRQLADETVLVVAKPASNPTADYAVWRIARDNTATELVALPGLGLTGNAAYGSADISADGTRVAYVGANAGNLELRAVTIATGATTVLAPNARSPRWSPTGDRVAYLELGPFVTSLDGRLVVINADGTNKRSIGSATRFNSGISWSPDGVFIVGRSLPLTFRIVRVSDGADVGLRFPANGIDHDYQQPDWR